MRSYVLTTIIGAILVFTAGCASIGGGGAIDTNSPTSELVVKYATLKVLEDSDSITGPEVVAHVERVRGVVSGNTELSLAALVQEVRGPIDWGSLSPADQMLLDALISQITYSVGDVPKGALADDRRVRILTLLDWVEQAATYAN